MFPESNAPIFSNVMVGICDDRRGNYVAAFDAVDLEVYAPGGHQDLDGVVGEARARYPDVTYRLELGFDGEHEASLRVNGTRMLRVDVGDLREGGVFLLAYTRIPVKIQGFEIEGKLAKGALAALRKNWVERRLEECGF